MANRARIPNGVGMMAEPALLTAGPDGKIPISALQLLNGQLVDVFEKINGLISFGDGSHATQSGNINGQWIEGVTPSVADTEFEVFHGLGKRATGFFVLQMDKAAILYVSNIGSWASDVLYLKCNVASVTFRIIVV
ncbi:MAG: hypothetical protein ACREJ6_10140 [Candidatus Methylomirabilis sp.]